MIAITIGTITKVDGMSALTVTNTAANRILKKYLFMGCDRSSVFDERGPLSVDPLLESRAAPFLRSVIDESFRYRVAEHDQTLQHHREIDIRDRPVAKEVVRASVEQGQRG